MAILVARKARAKAQRLESARHGQKTAKRPVMRTRRWLRVGGAGHRSGPFSYTQRIFVFLDKCESLDPGYKLIPGHRTKTDFGYTQP